ncbi:hypothetical protein D3C81_1703050 [compost metagenome]
MSSTSRSSVKCVSSPSRRQASGSSATVRPTVMLRTIANCEAGAALSDCPKSFLNMGDYLGLPRADCEQTEAMRPNDADHGLKFRAALPDVKRSCYALHET